MRYTRESPRWKAIVDYGETSHVQAAAQSQVQLPSGTHGMFDGTSFSMGNYIIELERKTGGVYVAAQQVDGITVYKSTETGTAKGSRTIEDHRARYWFSGDKAITWEKRSVFINGTRHDLPLPDTSVIRAACVVSRTDILLLVKDNTGLIKIEGFTLGDTGWTIKSSYAPGFDFTPLTGNESDIKHLYSAFLNAGDIVTVEMHPTETRIIRVTYDNIQEQWNGPEIIDTIPGINVTFNLDYKKIAKIDRSPAEIGGAGSMVTYDHFYVSPKLLVTDDVTMTGTRIVACSSDNTSLAILIQNQNTTCKVVDNMPQYGLAESYYILPNILMHPTGIILGMAYDYGISLSAFESNKLQETWDRTSNSSYVRKLYTFGETLTVESKAAFDGGSYTANTYYYERYAGVPLVSNGYGVPLPPPLESLIDINRAQAYSEMKEGYSRTWNNAVKLYCADPLKEVYLYEVQDGSANKDQLIYETRHFAKPSDDDLIVHNTFVGTSSFVLRKGDIETVLDSRPIADEPDYAMAYRYMLNFEPTMVYYTQNQPKRKGDVNVTRAGAKTINKSIDLSFIGRYTATDSTKSAVAYNLESTFDKPDNSFPTFVDQRYWFYTDLSPFPIMSSGTNYKRFFEGYRTGVGPPSGTPPGYRIDFRLFEDKNRILDNTATDSDAINLPTDRIPIEWPEIRGWYDFIMRGRFGPWEGLKGLRILKDLDITAPDPTNNPPITVTEDR